MTTSADVRRQLLETLELDLVGPRASAPRHSDYTAEILPIAPSNWYLTGFLVPYEAPVEQRTDPDVDDELDQSSDRRNAGDDDQPPEPASARKAYFPSSMGVSVLVPADTSQLKVQVAWGDYHPFVPVDSGGEAGGEADAAAVDPASVASRRLCWRRTAREADLVINLPDDSEPDRTRLPGGEGLEIVVSVRPAGMAEHLGEGVRSVSVFLVNYRPPQSDKLRDAAFAFQPELTLVTLLPFEKRPNLRGYFSEDWDEKVADLQYHDAVEYAVGHNVSAVAEVDNRGRCHEVRTAWMPTAEVEKVVARQIEGVHLGMEALAAASDADAVRAMIGPMVSEYQRWIERQATEVATKVPGDAKRSGVAKELLDNAGRARRRLAAGLDLLDDPQVLEAFKIANRAIARAIRQRSCHDQPGRRPEDLAPPIWRPFQLAFLLMNLPGVASGEHEDRKIVDLLFFPTGGGKTEAYLGLAAFVLVLRRLRDPSIRSAGVSVLMRYTLRLLTLDQLGRAATLICALELERQQDTAKLGAWPFEIGLWVGQAATPNRMGKKGDKDSYSARARTLAYQRDARMHPSPIPLENCPWCGRKFNERSFELLPDANQPEDLRVFCPDRRCELHSRRQKDGLPILAVDDSIYRRLPCFLVATVDKFASLPWVGETAGLFGRVERYDSKGFYGPSKPGVGRALDGPEGGLPRGGLPPMDLVIQDELHLISGPLGTMVGLYETAIDALCALPRGAAEVRPKIVASTATVRRAEKQIRGLFGRSLVDIFPPPGPDRRDSFFAETVSAEQRHPRTYVGIAAQGRNLKVVLLRTYLALLSAAQKAWQAACDAQRSAPDEPNPADPYMTLLGYFNSLRELGGSRRIVEDEVYSRLADYGSRRRRVGEGRWLFADRKKTTEPRELTSRVSTNEVAETKRRLAASFHDDDRVDVALATNMISVGLDIVRLGLMVVLGQPKTASEYIQATSRVGRDDERPGLVVTLLNVYRPRDRSHYERFTAWHESFYRAVEATSVTPFSDRALDRGLPDITVALARLGHPGMTPPRGAAAITRHRRELDFVAELISRRAERHDDAGAEAAEALRQKVRDRVVDLLDAWEMVATKRGEMQYQKEVGQLPPLLFDPLDPDLERQTREAQRFKAHRSLRDVEPGVKLWLRTPDDLDVEET